MAKDQGFDDLFKSELGSDYTGVDCPHCAMPLLKSEVLAKGKLGQELGNERGSHRGPEAGKSSTKGPRTNKGAKPHDQPNGLPGMYQKGEKCEDCGKSPCVCGEKSDAPDMKKGTLENPVLVGGSAYVQYMDSGEDARIAKSIQEQDERLRGSTMVSQPLDKNNSPSRK
jgi:hypothetical protein